MTAVGIGMAGAVLAMLASWSAHSCGGWLPFGCHGADPELTRLAR
jgi:hypothetical protein